MLETFSVIEDENLNPELYLLANPDVAQAGVDPATHYLEFGRQEGRKQINPELFMKNGYRNRKFERFRTAIKPARGEAPPSGFPLLYGQGHLDLSCYQAESANEEPANFTKSVRENPQLDFLDLGCGLRRRLFDNCLYVEVYPSLSADLVVPPKANYPIADESFDGIGCFAVLEHIRQPWIAVGEIHRMLKPGGRVWIDWPFLQPVHGYPSHYFNATREGLKSIFADCGFSIEESGTGGHEGPDHTIHWILSGLAASLPEGRERDSFLEMKVSSLIANHPQNRMWKEILARLPDDEISRYACGNNLIATKPA